jgi:hypothetical protein
MPFYPIYTTKGTAFGWAKVGKKSESWKADKDRSNFICGKIQVG